MLQEADLTAWHGALRNTGLNAVTAPTVEEVDSAVAAIEQASIQASCETLGREAGRRVHCRRPPHLRRGQSVGLTRIVAPGSTSGAAARVGSSAPSRPAISNAACPDRCAERTDWPFAMEAYNCAA